MTPGWTASVRRVAIGLVLGLVGCTSAQAPVARTGSPSPTTSATPESLPIVAVTLTRPPGACPGPTPQPKQVNRRYGPLVGASPLWAGVYAEFDAEDRAYHASDAPRTEYGWRMKVLWVTDPDQEMAVEARGSNAATGEAMWFEADGEPTMKLALDPENPGVPPERGGWKEFPSYLYFPRAGCYELTARWSGGVWELGFGLGT